MEYKDIDIIINSIYLDSNLAIFTMQTARTSESLSPDYIINS